MQLLREASSRGRRRDLVRDAAAPRRRCSPRTAAASRMPGITPAMNSCAIETFGADAVDDHDDRRRDQQPERAGAGQRADRHALGIAARAPAPAASSCRSSRRSRRDEPETAAKIVQPMMLVCSRRPGSALQPRREAAGTCPRDSRVRNRISPIQTNSGSAVSVQLRRRAPDRHRHRVAGRPRARRAPCRSRRRPTSARPIQTPLPSSANSDDDQQRGDRRRLIGYSLRIGFGRLARHAAPRRAARAPARRRARSAARSVPTAIASCGIHSGVASLPVEMSLNGVRLPGEPHAVEGEQRREQRRRRASAQISSAAARAAVQRARGAA